MKAQLTYHSTHGAAHNFIRKLKNVIGNRYAYQKLSDLITEVVAIVSEQTVSFSSESRTNFLQVTFKHILRHMRNPQFHDSYWSPILCCPCWGLLNSSTKEVLLTIDYNSCMPEIKEFQMVDIIISPSLLCTFLFLHKQVSSAY